MEYSRGPEKTWIYGALRVRDGQARTLAAPARNSAGYLALLQDVEVADPQGDLYLITDNLSGHQSGPVREWLAGHPRVHQVFIPTRACWLNLVEGWWRLFRRAALAGQSFMDGAEIALASSVATHQLNARAKPWVWGRPPRHPGGAGGVLHTIFEDRSTREGDPQERSKGCGSVCCWAIRL
jgi:transposase